MSPLLSVIIPVHNSAPYVRKTVESIVNQDCDFEIEIILVENGSTDNSLDILKELASQYGNIKVFVSEKIGPSEARNYGIQKASGNLITFVDSDDYIEPDMYEVLVKAKQKYNAEVAYCNFVFDLEDGTSVNLGENTGNILSVSPVESVYDIIMERNTSSPCVKIFDKSFFDSRKFPENIFYEDHASIYKWMNDCKSLVFVDRPLYHYCVRSTGTTSTTEKSVSKLIDRFNADYDRLEFISNHPKFTDLQRQELLRHVTKELYTFLKKFATLKKETGDLASQKSFDEIYQRFLQVFSSYPFAQIGFKLHTKKWKVMAKKLLKIY